MLAGVHNKLLLVRPEWYPGTHEYGFEVSSISELAQFCELFGLRCYPIYWAIDNNLLRVRAMGPYSTFRPDFAAFGVDARDAAKQGGGALRFWFLMIVASLISPASCMRSITCLLLPWPQSVDPKSGSKRA